MQIAREAHAVASLDGVVFVGGGVVTDSPGFVFLNGSSLLTTTNSEVLLDSVEAYSCIPGGSDAVINPNLTLAVARKWLAAAAGPDRVVFAGGLYAFSCVCVCV